MIDSRFPHLSYADMERVFEKCSNEEWSVNRQFLKNCLNGFTYAKGCGDKNWGESILFELEERNCHLYAECLLCGDYEGYRNLMDIEYPF